MDLFEYALKHSGCLMISDMPRCLNKAQIIDIFSDIPIEEYTLNEWNEVLRYLLGRSEYQIQRSLDGIYKVLGRKR